MKSILNLSARIVDILTDMAHNAGEMQRKHTAPIFQACADIIEDAAEALAKSDLPQATLRLKEVLMRNAASSLEPSDAIKVAKKRLQCANKRLNKAWDAAVTVSDEDVSNAA